MHGVVESCGSEEASCFPLKGERAGQSWTIYRRSKRDFTGAAGKYLIAENRRDRREPDFICTWMVQRPNLHDRYRAGKGGPP